MSDAPPPYLSSSEKSGPPGEYPPQAGYPPQQAGYPPQQAGYPPQQAGYPPQQAGYPPQQAGYPPQQAGYPPPGQGGYQEGYPPPGAPGAAQTVVVAQPTTAIVQVFNETPVHTICPHCRADIVTATQFESGTCSWLVCFCLCIFGCSAGCCLLPFCMDSCQDVVHTCPNCRQQISHWSRM